ncbi:MAG: hypothetical protein CMG33_03710 [Candidatus Marinimicrobia bacterium]|nr:hypothetical protein [Candidatus Neomarinimicrobiota bacterium]
MFKRTLLLFCCLILSRCDDFLTGDLLDNNPNKIGDVDQISIESLFVGSQVTLYGVMEGYLNRLVTSFMQQVAAVVSSTAEDYRCLPLDWRIDDRWGDMYGTGGLVDLRTIQQRALEQEKYTLLGISEMWEALIFSTAADLWGSVPYSQAVNPRYTSPVFDSQREIHDSIIDLLDNAIVHLQQGQDFKKLNDFTFDGDQTKWTAAARTLQARIRLNWAEVDGINAYQEALAYAEQGISEPSGSDDWRPLHRAGNNDEESIWHQFFNENFNDIMAHGGAGLLLVDMLKKDQDGRLPIYFSQSVYNSGDYSTFNDSIVGTAPYDTLPPPYPSHLNQDTFGAEDWGVQWVSWHENQFIKMECQYKLGQESNAQNTLNNTLSAMENNWQETEPLCVLPRYENINSEDLFAAIMNEKYKTMFLNMQALSDWRRTGYPVFLDGSGNSTECISGTPRRLPYSDLEKSANPNAPTGDSIYDRVQNDPN